MIPIDIQCSRSYCDCYCVTVGAEAKAFCMFAFILCVFNTLCWYDDDVNTMWPTVAAWKHLSAPTFQHKSHFLMATTYHISVCTTRVGESVEVDASIYIGKSQHYNGSLYRLKEGEWNAERERREKREERISETLENILIFIHGTVSCRVSLRNM